MPMMVASTGSFSVSGVSRALEPWTIKTISPCPAPTVSTTTKLRPVPTSRSRSFGSTRSGSTISSLRPVIDATFCVATTLPVTLAMNMGTLACSYDPARLQQLLRLSGDDQLLVGRHDPELHPAVRSMNRHLAPGVVVLQAIELDAEPVEVGADFGANFR